MKVLLTGATGLVGRQLTGRLAPEHELVALTRRTEPPAAPEGVAWAHQDLAQPLDPDALPDDVDAIVHLAQSERYRDLPEGAEDVFAVNVQSTFSLLEYARRIGAKRFVLASTGGVYEPSPEPIDEQGAVRPTNPYLRSKRVAELLAENYAEYFDLVVLRFFFVYGPGPSQTLIRRLADRINAGEEIVVDGDPGLRLNPIFAGDAARAVEASLDLPGAAVINVAGEQAVDLPELIAMLARALGREPSVTHTPGDQLDIVADIGRMRAELGVDPEVPLADGLDGVARDLREPV